MERSLQAVRIRAVQSCGNGGESSCDIEDDGGFFVSERVLTYWFLGECIVPYETYTNVIFVNGEAEVEEFELAIVAVKQISTSVIFPCSTSILAESLERATFLFVSTKSRPAGVPP